MGEHGDNIAVELAEMRGCMAAGFNRVEGQLAVIGERVERTQGDVKGLGDRVQDLEGRRWPLASVGVLSGLVSAAVAMVPFLAR